MPKIFQDVKKRDDKARTLAPPDDNEMFLANLSLDNLKNPRNIKNVDLKRPEKIKSTINKYANINLNDVNNLIDEIEKNVAEGDNIVDLGDNKEIYFRDLLNFLLDIKNYKINDFNRKEQYEKRIMNIENKLKNRKNYNANIQRYIKYLNYLKDILFSNRKSSGKGLNISFLPILLSKLNIKNLRELINDIKNLLNHLYNTKQITKKYIIY